MKMEQTECSETSAYKIQTPGIYPEENMQHSEHGESLESRSNVRLEDTSHFDGDRKRNGVKVGSLFCIIKQHLI